MVKSTELNGLTLISPSEDVSGSQIGWEYDNNVESALNGVNSIEAQKAIIEQGGPDGATVIYEIKKKS